MLIFVFFGCVLYGLMTMLCYFNLFFLKNLKPNKAETSAGKLYYMCTSSVSTDLCHGQKLNLQKVSKPCM